MNLSWMESVSIGFAIRAFPQFGKGRCLHDLKAFEHVAETLAETAPSSTSSVDAMRASLASLRVLLRLCAEPAAELAGMESRDPRAALEAFVAETFAEIDNTDAAANDDDALSTAPRTRARAARIWRSTRTCPRARRRSRRERRAVFFGLVRGETNRRGGQGAEGYG